ncbi:MAG: peptidylprolyl isomerase [Coriobacteriia bacterium]|nr:peptidylprolyl isomerase [Coriobacteriia bacterium]
MLYTPSYQPNGDEVAVFKTNRGDITVKLFGKDAPITVANFIELALKGYYDDSKFHRLVPGFVVQGGDPQTKDLSPQAVEYAVANPPVPGTCNADSPALGTGGPGYNIKGEFNRETNPNTHLDGALAMARQSAPDTAGSQFYFTLGEQSFLDGSYAVFGQTIEGLEVIGTLCVGDVIESITVLNVTA